MSLSSTDKGLLTPGNCAVISIDHQPQMLFGVANIDRQDLLNNMLVLAKAAKLFRVPVIPTAVESEGGRSKHEHKAQYGHVPHLLSAPRIRAAE
jgi:nicotinamidase-related amidase